MISLIEYGGCIYAGVTFHKYSTIHRKIGNFLESEEFSRQLSTDIPRKGWFHGIFMEFNGFEATFHEISKIGLEFGKFMESARRAPRRYGEVGKTGVRSNKSITARCR